MDDFYFLFFHFPESSEYFTMEMCYFYYHKRMNYFPPIHDSGGHTQKYFPFGIKRSDHSESAPYTSGGP